MTSTAVVILNYNGEKLLPQFLPSVIQYSGDAQIIVADNASTDRSIEILKKGFPQVSIIALDKNYGFCGGYNRALQQVKADYLLLLNSDVEVTSNWLTPLVTILDNQKDAAAVQPKILSWRERSKFEHAGAAGGLIDSLGYPFCRGRMFDHVEVDEGQYDDEREIFWATGACFLIRSSVYDEFGGLDEDFFAHMEEIDLCWKIHRSQRKIYYSGKSKVYHLGAGTLGYDSPRKVYLNFRNGLTMITKHFSSGSLLYKLPFRIFLDWVAAGMFLLKGKANNFLAVLKAHAHFFSGLGSTLRKRKELRKKYGFYRGKTIYPGLVIFDYYLKGRKRVNQ